MSEERELTREELERSSRSALAQALHDYADAYERPGLVTGFVAVFELTEPSGIQTCWWVSGNGAEPSELDEAGIASHRALGLLAYATRSVKRMIKR